MTPPLAVIRCDASPTIGAGHVTRCVALAEAFADAGWEILFAVGIDTVATVPALGTSGFSIHVLTAASGNEARALGAALPRTAELLIVDHYGRDIAFERDCRAWARRILVLDDNTKRSHDCECLVDSAATDATRYASRIPRDALLLIGPRFALMRRGFTVRRGEALARRDGRPVEEILVSFGATDPSNVTPAALSALASQTRNIRVTVAMASHAPHLADVRGCLGERGRLVLDGDMVQLMIDADVAIGAGGATSFERAVLGLPSIVVETAANQRPLCRLLADAGAALDAGEPDDDFGVRLARSVDLIVGDESLRVQMARNAGVFVDGRGAGRVVAANAGAA
jgi:UDP-2,4-diacetamido-2,4,6-trideoxy-beta-L-altropyranose hydrolase